MVLLRAPPPPPLAISYTLFWDSPGRISTRGPLCPIQVEVRIIKDRSLKARIYFKNICSLKRKELLSYPRDEIVEQKISFIGSQKWRKVEKGFMFKDFNRISWIRGEGGRAVSFRRFVSCQADGIWKNGKRIWASTSDILFIIVEKDLKSVKLEANQMKRNGFMNDSQYSFFIFFMECSEF